MRLEESKQGTSVVYDFLRFQTVCWVQMGFLMVYENWKSWLLTRIWMHFSLEFAWQGPRNWTESKGNLKSPPKIWPSPSPSLSRFFVGVVRSYWDDCECRDVGAITELQTKQFLAFLSLSFLLFCSSPDQNSFINIFCSMRSRGMIKLDCRFCDATLKGA